MRHFEQRVMIPNGEANRFVRFQSEEGKERSVSLELENGDGKNGNSLEAARPGIKASNVGSERPCPATES